MGDSDRSGILLEYGASPVHEERHRGLLSGQTYLVMWWIPAGTVPDIDDAFDRLTRLQDTGVWLVKS